MQVPAGVASSCVIYSKLVWLWYYKCCQQTCTDAVDLSGVLPCNAQQSTLWATRPSFDVRKLLPAERYVCSSPCVPMRWGRACICHIKMVILRMAYAGVLKVELEHGGAWCIARSCAGRQQQLVLCTQVYGSLDDAAAPLVVPCLVLLGGAVQGTTVIIIICCTGNNSVIEVEPEPLN